MSDLTRLRELAALFRPHPSRVLESKDALASLDSIRRIVTDAVGDLEDKLGSDGSLEILLKSNSLPVSFGHLASGIKEYKREALRVLSEVEKMLIDAEMEKATKPSDAEIAAHDAILRKHT